MAIKKKRCRENNKGGMITSRFVCMVNLNCILAIFPEWGQKAPPHPRENIIAGDYILADTQAFLSKRHRQQNKKILIRHITGISESFFVFKYSIN